MYIVCSASHHPCRHKEQKGRNYRKSFILNSEPWFLNSSKGRGEKKEKKKRQTTKSNNQCIQLIFILQSHAIL